METLSASAIISWIVKASAVIEANKAYLTELDAPIGDSDHGVNMARGFSAAVAKLQATAQETPAGVLKTIAMTLISTVGGASGPLYGTLFLQMAAKAGALETLDLAALTACLEAGVAGIVMRGKAQLQDKTMVDALTPMMAALKASAGKSLADALADAATAAKAGRDATIPLLARKGRASYLGERSIGHQDPGATSAAMLVQALADVVAGMA